MQYKQFVGIDIAKYTFDAFLREKKLHKQFKNEQQGFKALLLWIKKNVAADAQNILICFEHTGLYSFPLALFLEEQKQPFAMISALQIKRSLGITRGKNDLIDARRIAEYAYLFRESINQTKLPPKAILQLQPLLTLRDKMVRNMTGYRVTKKEIQRTTPSEDLPALFEAYDKVIDVMKAEIKKLEKAIKNIIDSNPELLLTFNLITGIKGVGFLVGAYMIVYTYNFTRFDNWRKFACYSGIAPFEFQSGISVRGKTKISPIANKQIKKMLHLAGLSAALTDEEMNEYYRRRLGEGKSKMATLNIIRNKVLARIFAVAMRKTEYVNVRKYAA